MCIEKILNMASNSVFGGHLGISRNSQRLTQKFYWPKVAQQIIQYHKFCDACQKMGSRRDKAKAKLCSLQVISELFKRISIGIVGSYQEQPEGEMNIFSLW